MSAVPPHPGVGVGVPGAVYAQPMQQVPDAAAANAAGAMPPPPVQSLNQTAEFFLSNYRLGKTLGIGSFGKVRRQ